MPVRVGAGCTRDGMELRQAHSRIQAAPTPSRSCHFMACRRLWKGPRWYWRVFPKSIDKRPCLCAWERVAPAMAWNCGRPTRAYKPLLRQAAPAISWPVADFGKALGGIGGSFQSPLTKGHACARGSGLHPRWHGIAAGPLAHTSRSYAKPLLPFHGLSPTLERPSVVLEGLSKVH